MGTEMTLKFFYLSVCLLSHIIVSVIHMYVVNKGGVHIMCGKSSAMEDLDS